MTRGREAAVETHADTGEPLAEPRSSDLHTVPIEDLEQWAAQEEWVASGAQPLQPRSDAAERESGSTGSWGWTDVDAVLSDNPDGGVRATVLRRSDGVGLLYPGFVNGLAGEAEAMKTMVALVGAVQEMEVERHVIFVDFEDTARSIILERLHRTLGVTAARLREFFHYTRPEEPITAVGNQVRLLRAVAALQPSLAVVDGVTEALALHGLASASDVDNARLKELLYRPLADLGAATLPLDHVVKDSENQGRYATGSQHKLSGGGGAMYRVNGIRTAVRGGQAGLSRLVIAKDRHADVRTHTVDGRTIAEFHFSAPLVGVATWSLEPPGSAAAAPFRPTHLMERVSVFIESCPAPVSARVIRSSVSGKAETVLIALQALISEHFVVATSGPRNALMHRSLRPFREAE